MNARSNAAAVALLAAAAALANAEPSQLSVQSRSANGADQRFAATATQDRIVEVALAGLALQKSRSNQVKQLALEMVQEHGPLSEELQAIVKRKGLILPTQLDAQHEAILRSLDGKSGAAFDKAYGKLIAHDRVQSLALFESASRSSDPDVAAFARKTLSTLQEHNQLANNLHVGMGMRAATAR